LAQAWSNFEQSPSLEVVNHPVMCTTQRKVSAQRARQLPTLVVVWVFALCLCRPVGWVSPPFAGRYFSRSGSHKACPAATAAQAADAAAPANTPILQARPTLDLIKEQNQAGQSMRELGFRLQDTEFDANALDNQIKVVYDGTQRLRKVEVGEPAVSIGPEALAQALLGAMQEAHDSSVAGSKDDVWQLYKTTPLLQAPLIQLGAGNTMDDPWANVTDSEEALRMTEEFFNRFDEDNDGYWNMTEASTVQKMTEGTEMTEEAFNSLVIAAAPDRGRHLTEEDVARGLSRAQVIDLYTNVERQKQLGFILNIYQDYEKVFQVPEELAEESLGNGGSEATSMVD